MAPPLDPHWGLMSLSTLGWTGPEGATPVHHQAAPVPGKSSVGQFQERAPVLGAPWDEGVWVMSSCRTPSTLLTALTGYGGKPAGESGPARAPASRGHSVPRGRNALGKAEPAWGPAPGLPPSKTSPRTSGLSWATDGAGHRRTDVAKMGSLWSLGRRP